MYLLDPTYIRNNVDYSFGDQSSDVHRLGGGYMKDANLQNMEFIEKYNEVKKIRNVMTLFIDNIRLYKRSGIQYTAQEENNDTFKSFKNERIAELFKKNDLLKLCAEYQDMNFIIFTGFEDTPIDEFIFEKIPDNVIKIYASNAISFGGKVVPIPYGIQRKLNPYDNRQSVLSEMINNDDGAHRLLYVNHNVKTNPERIKLNDYLSEKRWITLKTPKSIDYNDYRNYLRDIKSHKFMICPSGNAIGCECHRDWEVLYMKRVPVVKRSKYLEFIFKDFPVLFVDSFFDVTEKLLVDNDHLYKKALELPMDKLDFKILYIKYIKEAIEGGV